MTPLMAFSAPGAALALGTFVAIALLVETATRWLSRMLQRWRTAMRPDTRWQCAIPGAAVPRRRAIRRSRRRSPTVRRARRQ